MSESVRETFLSRTLMSKKQLPAAAFATQRLVAPDAADSTKEGKTEKEFFLWRASKAKT